MTWQPHQPSFPELFNLCLSFVDPFRKVRSSAVRPSTKKIDAVNKIKAPTDASGVRSTLGMFGYHRLYLPNYSDIDKITTSRNTTGLAGGRSDKVGQDVRGAYTMSITYWRKVYWRQTHRATQREQCYIRRRVINVVEGLVTSHPPYPRQV